MSDIYLLICDVIGKIIELIPACNQAFQIRIFDLN